MAATPTTRGAEMPKPKNEEIKKHGDTLEPLIDRTGESTQRRPGDEDARRRDDTDQDVLSDDA
jgi:hypothetical protein